MTAENQGQTSAGATEALVRIGIHNASDRAVASRGVSTGCWEFGGGIFEPPPFEIETGFSGACAAAAPEEGVICVSFGGQIYSSVAFAAGPIPARGDASCLVRLRFATPLTTNLVKPLEFANDRVVFVDGGIGFDAAAASQSALLSAGLASAIPTLGTASAMIPLSLLIIIGMRRRRAESGQNRGI